MVGQISVLGSRPAADPAQLSKVGYVAQDTPTYARLSIADHFRLGAHLNPSWDKAMANDRLASSTSTPASRPAGSPADSVPSLR
jgi:ABC-2 type transport system ATP-binding protein